MAFVEQDEESLLVKQAVKRLSELDVTGISPSQADFTRLVEEVLQEEVIPTGRFQRNGPTVVNLMAARGVPFRMVIIPGMVGKVFSTSYTAGCNPAGSGTKNPEPISGRKRDRTTALKNRRAT